LLACPTSDRFSLAIFWPHAVIAAAAAAAMHSCFVVLWLPPILTVPVAVAADAFAGVKGADSQQGHGLYPVYGEAKRIASGRDGRLEKAE